jgi:CheY-like chemotaxis protein
VTRVLVIDDEAPILRALKINLTARKYDVSTAADGASGLEAMARDRPDVLILDLGLPDMDGTEVIRGVRGWTSTPIIVLSAWGQESQKVAALDAGADDYVTKPFGMDELLARLRAAVRRASPAPDEPVVAAGDFTVDLAAKRVTRGGGDVRLTPPNGSCSRCWCATAGGWSASVSCCTRCGGLATRPRVTTCGCSWPSCAASWSRIRPGRVTCSPRPAWDTGSSPERALTGGQGQSAPGGLSW